MDSITSHFGPFVTFTHFLAQKAKIFETKKKSPRDIIIVPQRSQPFDADSITDHSRPIFALLFHFWPKIKNFENWKNAWNVLKLLKNGNHITCCSSGRVQASFLQIVSHFCSFTPFLPTKKQIFEKWKKKKAYRYYHFTYS